MHIVLQLKGATSNEMYISIILLLYDGGKISNSGKIITLYWKQKWPKYQALGTSTL